MTTRPLVFVGPSAPVEDVERWLPGAEIKPPVSRGDLYLYRALRYGVFVMIDGVFLQERAIPPREVIDVLADGAVVIGASSMGALRAAECWPAGMRGVGSIYRDFRSGALESDDEVAVTFDPERPYPSLSVALVNVRFAVRRETEAGRLDAAAADHIIASAISTFYADRTWLGILDGSGTDADLVARLRSHDLKRSEAVRALRLTAHLVRRDPGALEPRRRSTRPFTPSEMTRERSHEASASILAARPELVQPLLLWLIVSGRIRAATGSALGGASGKRSPAGLEDLLQSILRRDRRVTVSLLERLEEAGALDAAWFRFSAIRDAINEASANDARPTTAHRLAAESDIARDHGFDSYDEIIAALGPTSDLSTHVHAYRQQLTLVKWVRQMRFLHPPGVIVPSAIDEMKVQ